MLDFFGGAWIDKSRVLAVIADAPRVDQSARGLLLISKSEVSAFQLSIYCEMVEIIIGDIHSLCGIFLYVCCQPLTQAWLLV